MDCYRETEIAGGMMILRSFNSTSGMNSVLVHHENLGKIVCEISEKGVSASIFHKANAIGYYEAKEALILALKGSLKEYKDRQEASVEMFKRGIRSMELGNVGNPIPFKFKVGEIVRRAGGGSTALFKVTDISPDHGGKGLHRYYGRHILGGYSGAYEDELTPATKQDLRTWEERQP
jgi:hypothetical protein